MKAKIFALVAAFFMLMGGSAWAQSDVKGDVNKDGVVNEQDIAAILAIMAKNNGVAEKTKYYWYLGTEKLATDTEIESNGTQISKASEITNPLTWTSSDYVYFIYPTEFGTAKIVDDAGDDIPGKAVESLTWSEHVNYKGWRFNKDSQGVKAYITFSK